MTNPLTIWHNPRCSKSRAALALLRDRGVEPEIIEYLKHPPEPSEIKRVLGALGMAPRDLMRKGEAPYKDLDLGNAAQSETALIAAMAAYPVLIERPVVLKGAEAALGRPPEAVLKLTA
jgi:arsenate reductase (glutaredoxin)